MAKEASESTGISEEVFDHLVDLAAFELNDEEAEYLRAELNDQLRAIRELEAIPVEEHVPITSHGVPYSQETRPALREDRIVPCEEADDILSQAPEIKDRYVVVPDIPRIELE